jgi:hypothetical protein
MFEGFKNTFNTQKVYLKKKVIGNKKLEMLLRVKKT